jgi:hypothetical protein
LHQAAKNGEHQVDHFPNSARVVSALRQTHALRDERALQPLEQRGERSLRLLQLALRKLVEQHDDLGCAGQSRQPAVAQQRRQPPDTGRAGRLAGVVDLLRRSRQQRAQHLEHAHEVARHRVRIVAPEVTARLARQRWENRRPRLPARARRPVGDAHVRRRLEGVPPAGDGHPLRIAIELRVAIAHQPKRIFVEAEPDVQSVLLDAPGRTAARGTLAAQSKALLVNGHLVAPFELGAGQLEGGGHRGATATDDRNSNRRRAHDAAPRALSASDVPTGPPT